MHNTQHTSLSMAPPSCRFVPGLGFVHCLCIASALAYVLHHVCEQASLHVVRFAGVCCPRPTSRVGHEWGWSRSSGMGHGTVWACTQRAQQQPRQAWNQQQEWQPELVDCVLQVVMLVPAHILLVSFCLLVPWHVHAQLWQMPTPVLLKRPAH